MGGTSERSYARGRSATNTDAPREDTPEPGEVPTLIAKYDWEDPKWAQIGRQERIIKGNILEIKVFALVAHY